MNTYRTIDGVKIEDEMRVWDYDLEPGWVDLGTATFETNQNTGQVSLWFDVVRDTGRRKSMSHDRVWFAHPTTRKEA